MKSTVCFLLLTGLFAIFQAPAASAQRDYFTDAELEVIRDAQEIDRRIDALVHIIDRRFAVLQIDVGAPQARAKDSDKWGEMPTGTRTQLLFDVRRILQKAIDDIDSLAERPDSAVVDDRDGDKGKVMSDLFPKAVRNLAKAAERYEPVLKNELDKTTDNAAKGSLLDSIDMCSQIIASVGKLPPSSQKGKNKK